MANEQLVEYLRENFPGMRFDPEPNTLIKGAYSPALAVAVSDYPYGRLRCIMRYWLEYKPKNGTRLVSQTNNPKRPGVVWNKPHAGTYTDGIVVLFTNDEGHVKQSGFSSHALETETIAKCEATTAKLDAFVARYSSLFTAEDQRYVDAYHALIDSRFFQLTAPHKKTPLGSQCAVCHNYRGQYSDTCTGTEDLAVNAVEPRSLLGGLAVTER